MLILRGHQHQALLVRWDGLNVDFCVQEVSHGWVKSQLHSSIWRSPLQRQHPLYYKSFPSESNGKESACNAGDPGLIPGWRSPEKGWLPRWHWWKRPAGQCRRRKRRGFCPWIGKVPRTRAWQPAPVFLPGEFQGQGILVGYSPWGHKELDTTEQLTLSLWEVAVACHGRGTKEQICLVPRQFDRSSRWYISSGWAYQFDLSLSSMLCLKY